MNDIMKSVQALQDYNILMKGVTKAIKNLNKRLKRRIFRNVTRHFRNKKNDF